MKQYNKLFHFVEFVISNIEDILSILFMVVILLIDRIFPDFVSADYYFYAIFAILTAMAVGSIRNRYGFYKPSLKRLQDLSERMDQKVFNPIKAENFFQKPPVYDEVFPNSGEILITGISLVETIGMLHQKLHDSIILGARVKILLLDENSETNMDQLILRSWGKVNNDYYKKRVSGTYSQIQIIADKIKGAEFIKGSLEVGKLPFVPSFGIIAFIPEEIHAKKINVKIYHHLTNNPKPYFSIDYCQDKYWFEFFENQFREAWKISKPVRLVGEID